MCIRDSVIICDPEAEYAPLVERLHGQVIKISPTSTNYINPMDLNLDYSDDESPLSLKSDFILSLCEPVSYTHLDVYKRQQIFLKLGLVEVLDSGTFYMSNIELLIGQSSTEAERKRAARLQNKALSAPRTKVGHLSDIRPPEIEIELEKEIEIEKERERELDTGQPARAAYGLSLIHI